MDPTPSPSQSEELLVHGRFLRGLARGLVSDSERAEELLQETWKTALEHPPSHGTAPRAWLARILRGLAIKRGLRESERAGRESLAVLSGPAREVEQPDAIAVEIELTRRVLDSVERLREPYRSTLYLRYYRDLAPQSIASELGLPVKTVKTRLARGLGILREDLDRQHGGGRAAWVALLLPLARSWTPTPVPSVPSRVPSSAFPPLLAVPLVVGTLATGFLVLSVFLKEPEGREVDEPERLPSHVRAPAPTLPQPSRENARTPLWPGVGAPRPAAEDVRLRGRVLDLLGEPIPGAVVRAVFLGGDRRDPSGRFYALDMDSGEEVRTTSDVRGEFQLTLERAGLMRLSVEHRGHAPIGRRSLVFLGQELDLGALVLDPGVILSGRVLDPGGAPVAGAEVWQLCTDEGLTAGPDLTHLAFGTVTDDGGRFELDCQALGSWRLEARASPFAPATASGATTRPGERVGELVLEMTRGTTLRGRVLGLEPNRISGVMLLARAGGAPGEEPLLATLDARGGFELGGLVAGAELELVLVAAEPGGSRPIAKARRVIVGGDLDGEDIELVVEPGAAPDSPPGAWPERGALASDARGAEHSGAVEIHVHAPGGAPAPGALVARRRAGPGPRMERMNEVRAADADGRLDWNGLEEGSHEFRVVDGVFGLEAGTGGAWKAVRVETHALAADGDDADGGAELVLDGVSTVELTGSAHLDGQPLVRAELLLWPAREPGPEGEGLRSFDGRRSGCPALLVRSDGEGRFVFRELPMGAYHLELFHPLRALAVIREVNLDAPEQDLSLELVSVRLRGEVRTREGLPLAGARVRALPIHEERSRPFARNARASAVECGPAGDFALLGLEPEQPVRLEVACEGYATLETSAAPPELFREILLDPEAMLALELVAERQAFLLLSARGPMGLTRTVRVVPGEITRLSGLGAGAWNLELFGGGLRGAREASLQGAREVLLVPGENRLRWVIP